MDQIQAARRRTDAAPRPLAERTIAADPTSVALLLAGPAGLDLWPGVRRVSPHEHGVVVEVALPVSEGATAGRPRDLAPDQTGLTLEVRARPPLRRVTSYLVEVEFDGDLGAGTGQIVLEYLPPEPDVLGQAPRTRATVAVAYQPAGGSQQTGPRPDEHNVLREMAEDFLASVAAAAEQRADAA